MTSSSLTRVLGVIGAIFLFLVVTPGANAYPPGTSLTITAGDGVIVISNGQPGCSVTVTGGGFSDTTTIDSDGMAVIDADLPDGTELEATVSGPGCAVESATGVVRNSGGGGGGGGGTPSRTGANTALGLLVGLGALGAGGGIVVVSRRRKS